MNATAPRTLSGSDVATIRSLAEAGEESWTLATVLSLLDRIEATERRLDRALEREAEHFGKLDVKEREALLPREAPRDLAAYLAGLLAFMDGRRDIDGEGRANDYMRIHDWLRQAADDAGSGALQKSLQLVSRGLLTAAEIAEELGKRYTDPNMKIAALEIAGAIRIRRTA